MSSNPKKQQAESGQRGCLRKVPTWLAITIIAVAALLGIGLCKFTEWNNYHGKEMYGHYVDIRMALWAYRDDLNRLPNEFKDLVTAGYLDEIPLNPYTGERLKVVDSFNDFSTGVVVYEPEDFDGDGVVDIAEVTLRGFYWINTFDLRVNRIGSHKNLPLDDEQDTNLQPNNKL